MGYCEHCGEDTRQSTESSSGININIVNSFNNTVYEPPPEKSKICREFTYKKSNPLHRKFKQLTPITFVIGIILVAAIAGVSGYYMNGNRIDIIDKYGEKGDERYPLPYNDTINNPGYTENVLADSNRQISLIGPEYGWINVTIKWNINSGNLSITKNLGVIKEVKYDGFYSIICQNEYNYADNNIGSINIENADETILYDIYINYIEEPEESNGDYFYTDDYWIYNNPTWDRTLSLNNLKATCGDYDYFYIWMNKGEMLYIYFECILACARLYINGSYVYLNEFGNGDTFIIDRQGYIMLRIYYAGPPIYKYRFSMII